MMDNNDEEAAATAMDERDSELRLVYFFGIITQLHNIAVPALRQFLG